ncbi:MAG: hypothetical protein ACI4PF_03515 [Christensenellales bacterium]
MANLRTQKKKDKNKIAKIEKKYDKLINQAIKDFMDKPISELCDVLDNLKSDMHKELYKAGVLVEN